MSPRELADQLLAAAQRAADPRRAVRAHLPGSLDGPPVHLLAIGKASLTMAAAATERIEIARALATAVPEQAQKADLPQSIEVLVADHPIPSERNVEAAGAVERFCARLTPDDTLLVLTSGGGSAHLALPDADLTLDDLQQATKLIQKAGAHIRELNAVRKHCERLKGGRLAAIAAPARVRCLVLSDVIGDRLDTISSGPFAPDETTFAEAMSVLERHRLADRLPRIREHLRRGARGELTETPKPGDPLFERVHHEIISSNAQVVEAVAARARETGVEHVEQRTQVTGEAMQVGRELVRRARSLRRDGKVPAAVILGGETTVTVGDQPGLGGRAQEVALSAALSIEGLDGFCIAAYGTDGIDGPTDAAGAIVTGETAGAIRAAGIDPAAALARHDSHRALAAAGALIRTGPTGTNVNDVMLAVAT